MGGFVFESRKKKHVEVESLKDFFERGRKEKKAEEEAFVAELREEKISCEMGSQPLKCCNVRE